MQSYTEKLQRAEKLRELGFLWAIRRATAILEDLLRQAFRGRRDTEVVEVAGHLALCYRHLYTKTQDRMHLEEMRRAIDTGLSRAYTYNKAPLLVHSGDLWLLRNRPLEAEDNYKAACDLVGSSGHTAAEYLGRLAEAHHLNGSSALAIHKLKRALNILKRAENARPFHRRIIECGLWTRMIAPAKKEGRNADLQEARRRRKELAIHLLVYDLKPLMFGRLLRDSLQAND